MLVDSLRSLSIEDEAILSQLIQRYQLTREEADALLKKDRRGIDMENRPIRILYEGGSGEIVEKKSRFIATIEKIETEEDALAFIAGMKKQYWDARHNCYAFVAGKNHELQRCSDDGEPNGTAGRPMLDVLLREDIHNLAVVVTRYFGGTLLGTGGLDRKSVV